MLGRAQGRSRNASLRDEDQRGETPATHRTAGLLGGTRRRRHEPGRMRHTARPVLDRPFHRPLWMT